MKSMNDILPTNETTEFENRTYVVPGLGVTATDQFVENYRGAQMANNQQIAEQTANLGTSVPSSLGGLGTGTDYWASRLQTPNTASVVANLRATAQAQALNEALANEQAMWKKRYNEAYRRYQKRSWDKANSTTSDTTTDGDVVTGDVETSAGASTIEIDPLTGKPGYYSVVDPYTGVVTDVPIDGGANSQRELTYTDVSVNDMRNKQYQNEEGKNTWGWVYKLPSGKEVGVKYPSQKIVLGSDGNYYKYEKGTYSYLGR